MASEADTRANYIDPALVSAGWLSSNVSREHYFTDGRKMAGGVRGRRCFVDYLLHKDSRYLAVVEAKKESEHPTKGLQQAIDYAKKLCVRFVYSSNGKQTYEFDLETGKGDYIEFYPTPVELEKRYTSETTGLSQELRNIPFHLVGAMQPRYYQELAVHSVTDAIGEGKSRILLTLATGTGKTFIAFQIVHKVFQARWNRDNPGSRRPRILFLADRNILADQAINTFNPYEKDLIKINGEEVRKRNGVVPTNAHIFFAIYQAIAERENIDGYYKAYPKDFFDMVLIDECHRGAANEAGSWRAILDHFSSAVHLGLTATPKRSDNVDTYEYFGQPAYVYSLKDGINDGFLTPYRVKRIRTNLDELVLTNDDVIVEGESSQDLYQVEDYDRKIIVDERTELVAKAILQNINPLDKTIVFCENQNHALTMRDMINKNKSVKDPHYCVRVTSDEGKIGRELLEKFQDNDKNIPTIITSSQMLTTGVDARNVRNVVLDRTIDSMVEFKQIVGRGTRVFDGKDYFTIVDFRGATNNFYDEEWDGEPQAPEPGATSEPTPPPSSPEPPEGGDRTESESSEPRPRLKVKLGKHRELKVIDIETRYIDESGKPLSIQEFVERLIQQLPGLFKSVDELRDIWSDPDLREQLLTKLVQAGFDTEQLSALRRMFEADDCDIFDLLAFLAFERPMATRKSRVEALRSDTVFFAQYPQESANKFLHFVLSRYEKIGVMELSRERLPALIELSGVGTIKDASIAFGGKPAFVLAAFKQLQLHLYHVN
ncbi:MULTISPECIES: EcoAI/FtnUII family type I restriction enzme subunit R [Enterobacteriaceae]|uniref:DEAD/DEAH box helicase n=1 Tax=Leclercia adecarboxylata TaxID=83655 RepID=A0A855EB13_9ENTR|nr:MULTISPECIES: DEAD/DEAH box helicase family protein [Enterobacteriaceae]KFC91886.1 type I restriction-modification system, restriction subunit R [Leclercia adecarboxylata ATCC 23216 = NBRC 102595]PHH02590.1 DEAD/DEAH box helicase [Leclercia adecarboxylata]UBH66350.1 DEAD/DEAH box helicase family protein [Leclercia adecarboxylata]SPX66157.1 Type-1 restriction enzyme R protein [Leclercia adecarboxylata]STX25342.1 Type-1 restriction enzyme R protein [Leclercia adecarboxylata]